MMYYDQFNTGKRIQKLRRERYLTQEELAVRLNVSDRHLRSLESGEYIPSIDLFIEIAAFFDVTPIPHLMCSCIYLAFRSSNFPWINAIIFLAR